jgi:hypothetical protein
LNLFVTSNASQYAANLFAYADETGKTIAEALAREGPDFRTELYNQFRRIHPRPDSIPASAKARGYRVRRLANSALVKVQGGVSQRALSRAAELLGGQKSDLFRWAGSSLVPVRFSARNGNRVLRGRSGRRFGPSALRAYQLSPGQLQRVSQTERYKSYGVRRLNMRALAVYLELMYRQRASHGGTMGIQWLFKSWTRTANRPARMVQRSATGVPIGTVDFEFVADLLNTIVFNGYVPGSGVQAQRHGILDKVFAARSPRLLAAIRLHHEKVARQRGL